MDIHNIGGLRRWRSWETADIGVLVFVYQGKRLIVQKAGFLQTKRLYPRNNDVQDDDPVGFVHGMNAFLNRDPSSPLGSLNRLFEFDSNCQYGALKAQHSQVDNINRLNERFGGSVFYMFYNPPTLPRTVKYPVLSRARIKKPGLGCRVFLASEVHSVLNRLKKDHSPTWKMIKGAGATSNWALENWAADLLLTCKAGQQFDKTMQETVTHLLERRTGPIGAAIAVSIALPSE